MEKGERKGRNAPNKSSLCSPERCPAEAGGAEVENAIVLFLLPGRDVSVAKVENIIVLFLLPGRISSSIDIMMRPRANMPAFDF